MSCKTCGSLKPIAIGLYNLMVDKEKQLSYERLQYCLRCEQLKKTPLGNKCKLCGCYVLAKTRVPNEKCPLNKW
jgi:hypothetical protein